MSFHGVSAPSHGDFHVNTGPHGSFDVGGHHNFDTNHGGQGSIGGSLNHNHGHNTGTIDGSYTIHPTDHTSVGVHGSMNSNGGYNYGIGGTITW